MLDAVDGISRYISCSRVTKRLVFEFISSEIRPNDALMVFAFEDDYTFGIIQSGMHWRWFVEKCSTLEGRFRYTADSVWDTFPFPQQQTEKQIEKAAKAAKKLREARNDAMKNYAMSLRDLYRVLEQGKHPINDLQADLDKAVMDAYGFNDKKDLLEQLLVLNRQVAANEAAGKPVQPSGLPEWVKNKERFVSDDCVKFIES